MKLSEICEMASLTKSNLGFGMSEYANDNFVLSGGYRSGSSTSDRTRLKYDIYDMELYNKSNDVESSKVGFTELFVDHDGEIVGLVNIELDPKYQKGGRGAKLIKDITDTTKNGLSVHDIQTKAKKFWDKVGTEYTDARNTQGKINKN